MTAVAKNEQVDAYDYDVSRHVLMHVCADGTVTYRTRDEPNFNGASLPIYSVESKEMAEDVRVLACVVMPYEHPLLKGQKWYVLRNFGGGLEHLPDAAKKLKKYHDLLTDALARRG